MTSAPAGARPLPQLPTHSLRARVCGVVQGAASEWAPLLRTLPSQTLSPILWSEQELDGLLKGSPVRGRTLLFSIGHQPSQQGLPMGVFFPWCWPAAAAAARRGIGALHAAPAAKWGF
jgi:hypothetical protein